MSLGEAAALWLANGRMISCVVCARPLGGTAGTSFHVPIRTFGVVIVFACTEHPKGDVLTALVTWLRGLTFVDDETKLVTH